MIVDYSFDEEFKKNMKKLFRMDKAYELRELDGIGEQLDVNEFSRRFFSKNTTTTADVSVDANANIEDISVIHYESELVKPLNRLNAYFILWKYARQLYDSDTAYEMLMAQFTKDIYINDMHTFATKPYCANFSCFDVVCLGLPFVKKIKSAQPKHLSSFIGQMIQFTTYASNSVAGAVGLADILICCSYFVTKLYKDNPTIPVVYLDKQIKQELQSLIYSLNQPFRGGIQSAFTNISIYDETFLDKMCSEYHFPDGTQPQKSCVKFLQNMFLDLMNETLEKSAFTFPIITACFSIDKNNEILDKEFLSFIAEKNNKFGFINIYAGKTSTLSSCCRLRSNSDNEFFNTFGAGSTKIGSVGVVTINLPRIAYLSKSEEEFMSRLSELVILSTKINQVKRHIQTKRIVNNNAPLYTHGFINLKRQYSTCGLVGINEACEIMGYNILQKDGQEFVKKLLATVNDINDIQSSKYEVPMNCEQVPSEQSSIKIAQADKLLGYNKKYPFYSNQFIPLIVEADLIDRIKLQGMFDSSMSGGAICHLNFADKIAVDYMKKVISFAISQGVVYMAINYNLQSCKNNHITVGKGNRCEICGEKIVDNFTRVVGFVTSVNHWAEKRREFDYPNRQFYKKEEINLTPSQ